MTDGSIAPSLIALLNPPTMAPYDARRGIQALRTRPMSGGYAVPNYAIVRLLIYHFHRQDCLLNRDDTTSFDFAIEESTFLMTWCCLVQLQNSLASLLLVRSKYSALSLSTVGSS
jgi:hypothetical protein